MVFFFFCFLAKLSNYLKHIVIIFDLFNKIIGKKKIVKTKINDKKMFNSREILVFQALKVCE